MRDLYNGIAGLTTYWSSFQSLPRGSLHNKKARIRVAEFFIFIVYICKQVCAVDYKNKKRCLSTSSCFFILRRILDSNQWIPYDIGSLANCWFKPLTQPSVHLIFKSVQKYSFFLNLQNNLTKFFKNNGLAIFIAA